MTSTLLFKRADLVLVDGLPRMAGAFACAPVATTQKTRCVRPTSPRCTPECHCGFSAYPTRVEALSFRAPLAPVCDVLAGDFLRRPTRRQHAIYRHQTLVGATMFPVCWTCGSGAAGYTLRKDGPVNWDLRVLAGTCLRHLAGFHHQRDTDGAPVLLGPQEIGEVWGIEVREAGAQLSTLMARRHLDQDRALPAVRRCWCARLDGMTAAGGERLYFELGLFANPDFYRCRACGVRWHVDHAGPWFLRKSAG